MASKVGDIFVSLSLKNDKFNKGWNNSASLMEKRSTQMLGMATKLSVGLTAPLTLVGKSAFDEFRKFDKAMTQSTAIMGNMTDKVKKGMEDQARALSLNSNKSATDLATSYLFLASAGLDAGQSIATMPTILQFATAGMFTMEKATTLLVDAQRGLGLSSGTTTENLKEMNRVANVLVRANQLANASTEQYSKALTNKAAPALKLVNKSVEEGVAILAAYADSGLAKGARAGTFLDIALRELSIKAIKNKDAFEKLGFTVFDSNEEMLHMADILGQLEVKFEGMSAAGRRATLMNLGFTAKSVNSIAALVGYSDRIREWDMSLQKAGGTLASVADKQLKSFDAQIVILTNRFAFIEKEIGERFVPVIDSMNDAMEVAIVLWGQLTENQKNWVVGIGAAVAAIGPMLGLMGAMGLLIPLMGKGIALMAVLAGKMLLVGASIAFVIGLMDFFANNEDFSKGLDLMILDIGTAWDELGVTIGFWADTMLFKMENLWGDIQFSALNMADGLVDSFKAIFSGLINQAKAAWSNLKQIVETNPFEASQDARNNTAFASQRLAEVGIDTNRFKGKSDTEAFSSIDQTGKSQEELKEIARRVMDFYKSIEAGQDAHDGVMSAKAFRNAENKLRKQKQRVDQAAINQRKANANSTIASDALARETAILGGSDPKNLGGFGEHLVKRFKQLRDEIGKFAEFSDEEWEKITKAQDIQLDEMVSNQADAVDRMQEKSFEFSEDQVKINEKITQGFTGAWENMLTTMLDGTATLQSAFQALGMELLKVVLQQQLIKPLAGSLGGGSGNLFEGAFKGIAGIAGMFGGGAAPALSPTPLGPGFANGGAFGAGGVLTSPTPFSMGDGRTGVAGEAGPEAALPLARMSNGKLGVESTGGGGRTVVQNFNITTPDADSFRRSQRQIGKRMRNL